MARTAGHQEVIRAAINALGQSHIEILGDGRLVRVLLADAPEEIVVMMVPGAWQHRLQPYLFRQRFDDGFRPSEILLVGQMRDGSHDRNVCIILVAGFEHIRDQCHVPVVHMHDVWLPVQLFEYR